MFSRLFPDNKVTLADLLAHKKLNKRQIEELKRMAAVSAFNIAVATKVIHLGSRHRNV